MALHVCAAVVVLGCIALAWWQAARALSGNTLSWAYTFEWPVFGAYAVFMWWKLLHERAREHPRTDRAQLDDPAADRPAQDDRADDRAQDSELAEYNEYLAALSSSGRRKRW